MRLIDADELMEQYDFYNEFAVHDLRYLKKECLPFVEAIPIEWIEEYRQNREDYADEYNAKAVLKRLLETWEKENEKS